MKYINRYLSLNYKTNDLVYKELNTREMNFLMVILSKASIKSEENNNTVEITRQEMLNTLFLKDGDDKKTFYSKNYIEMFKEFFSRVNSITIIDENERNGVRMAPIFSFTHIETDLNATFELSKLGIELTKKLKKGEFFKFFLVEYLMVKNKYAKRLFTELSQLEKLNNIIIHKDSLIKKLGLEKYEESGNLETKALKPAIEELKIFWPRLEVEKVRRGKKIIAYKFKNIRRFDNWEVLKEKIEQFEQKMEEEKEKKEDIKINEPIEFKFPQDDCDSKDLDITMEDLEW